MKSKKRLAALKASLPPNQSPEPNQFPFPEYDPFKWQHAMVIRMCELCIDALWFRARYESNPACVTQYRKAIKHIERSMDLIVDDYCTAFECYHSDGHFDVSA